MRLSEVQLQQLVDRLDDLSDVDFDSDEDYLPPDDVAATLDQQVEDEPIAGTSNSTAAQEPATEGETEDELSSEDEEVVEDTLDILPDVWTPVKNNYSPRRMDPAPWTPQTLIPGIQANWTEVQIFWKIFPISLFVWIAQCTNERLAMLLALEKKINIPPTNPYEIMIVLGCYLVMSYNRVPALVHYWSSNPSLGNQVIKEAISRNRFQLLSAKMYFNTVAKPNNASKTYYEDQVVECLKAKFQSARGDSTYQSIDEAMVKFKGRSALKQYLPLKPTKRGIKVWERCDSTTDYTYNFNIYCGKEGRNNSGTLGERVVTKLCETIRNPSVTLCFDRFFTSTKLLISINYSALGTCISNRKNMPKFEKRTRTRGDSEFLSNQYGTTAVLWQNIKEVLLLSNFHDDEEEIIYRKAKDGTRQSVMCPKSIIFYNSHMGGVDLSDQLVGYYNMDRKSTKWWKKVFYRLFMVAVLNASIISQDVKKEKKPLLSFDCPRSKTLDNFTQKIKWSALDDCTKFENRGQSSPL